MRTCIGEGDMSHNLNSLKGFLGDYIEDYYRGYINEDTRSLDYSSHNVFASAKCPKSKGAAHMEGRQKRWFKLCNPGRSDLTP